MNKILYVDDDKKLGEVAKSILETFGYQVIIIDIMINWILLSGMNSSL